MNSVFLVVQSNGFGWVLVREAFSDLETALRYVRGVTRKDIPNMEIQEVSLDEAASSPKKTARCMISVTWLDDRSEMVRVSPPTTN